IAAKVQGSPVEHIAIDPTRLGQQLAPDFDIARIYFDACQFGEAFTPLAAPANDVGQDANSRAKVPIIAKKEHSFQRKDGQKGSSTTTSTKWQELRSTRR